MKKGRKCTRGVTWVKKSASAVSLTGTMIKVGERHYEKVKRGREGMPEQPRWEERPKSHNQLHAPGVELRGVLGHVLY